MENDRDCAALQRFGQAVVGSRVDVGKRDRNVFNRSFNVQRGATPGLPPQRAFDGHKHGLRECVTLGCVCTVAIVRAAVGINVIATIFITFIDCS